MQGNLSLFILVLSIAVVKSSSDTIDPLIEEHRVSIGSDEKTVQVYTYGERKDLVFINLHDNEKTAITSTQALLEKSGGIFIRIKNAGLRNVNFRMNRGNYTFDPNRIFTTRGIRLTLAQFGSGNETAVRAVKQFADRILALVPEHSTIVAVHNNTDKGYSVSEYGRGRNRSRDARYLHLQTGQDRDDFFLTTSKKLFDCLAAARFNTVMQDNSNAFDDGSLSIYCGRKGITYVNCETEHGKDEQFHRMIRRVVDCL